MAISFENALGVHPLALKLREQRSEVLASNLANVDTPNYKARDVDFQAVLRGTGKPGMALAQTQAQHLSAIGTGADQLGVKYRVPAQASLDGNTVESEQEQMRYGQNALQYQFSLRLVSDKFAGLKSAIKGE